MPMTPKYMNSFPDQKITRIEVLDHEGRKYVKWEKRPLDLQFVLQDDGRTLKIFINFDSYD